MIHLMESPSHVAPSVVVPLRWTHEAEGVQRLALIGGATSHGGRTSSFTISRALGIPLLASLLLIVR